MKVIKVSQLIIISVLLLSSISCSKDGSSDDIAQESHAIVGAIRWDAYHSHSPNNDPLRPVDAMEVSLGPKQYHFRAPYFTKIVNDSTIRIEGYTQEILDQEIDYAKDSGLDYWAFLLYDEIHDFNYGKAMSQGINYYLTSNKKNDINFCVIETPDLLFRYVNEEKERLINYIKESSYQKVMDNRPLIYFYGINDDWINYFGENSVREIMDNIREGIMDEGFNNPYIVIMYGDVSEAKRYLEIIGGDAISRYAIFGTGGFNGTPYTSLTKEARKVWEESEMAGVQVVPTLTAGWDRRPRIEHPVPWEPWQNPGEDIKRYYALPKPEELAQHVQEGINWVNDRKTTTCPSGAVLMYSWNEHDEGGWLCPTIMEDGGIDSSRIEAIKKVLK